MYFQAFEYLGDALRKVSGTSMKKQHFRENDVTLKYLGYWTDNGNYIVCVRLQKQTGLFIYTDTKYSFLGMGYSVVFIKNTES